MASSFEAGVHCAPDGHNHYWLARLGAAVDYLDQWPSTNFSPVAISFFLSDFGITPSEILDSHAKLDAVRQGLGTRHIFPDSVVVDGPAPDEGYFVLKRPQAIDIHFSERGQSRQLGQTIFPWVAGLYVAWLKDCEKLQYS